MNRNNIVFNTSAILLSAFLGMAIFHLSAMGHFVSNWWRDYKIVSYGPFEETSDDIVLVLITEDTLADLKYRSPIDRSFLAQTIAALQAKAPKAIGLDILFDQPTEPAKDKQLHNVFQDHNNRLAVVSATQEDGLKDQQLAYQNAFLDGVPKMRANLGKDPLDGVVRWVIRAANSAGHPPFVTRMAELGGHTGSHNTQEKIPLRYPLEDPIKPVSFAQYDAQIVPALPDSWFKDKYVFVGVDLPTSDRHRTPFSTILGENRGNLPGVYLHALGLKQTLEARNWSQVNIQTLSFLALCGALVGFGLTRIPVKTVWKCMITFTLIIILAYVDVQIFQKAELFLSPIGPVAAILICFAISSARNHWQERLKREYLHHAFSHYLSDGMIRKIVANPDALSLGGEKKEMTFLFADLEQFTNLSEACSMGQLIQIINEYNELVAQIIMDHDGTIDKFAGDGINAFFGAPLDDADHAAKAIACGLSLRQRTKEFSERYKAQGVPVGLTRVGIHSGEAVVGNFGGTSRFQYTAMGDAVNTAARLEGLNKYCGTYLLASAATIRKVSDVPARPIAKFAVKGKDELVEVFEPLDNADGLSDYIAFYNQLADNAPNALQQIDSLSKKYPDDRVLSFHLARLGDGETGNEIKMTQK